MSTLRRTAPPKGYYSDLSASERISGATDPCLKPDQEFSAPDTKLFVNFFYDFVVAMPLLFLTLTARPRSFAEESGLPPCVPLVIGFVLVDDNGRFFVSPFIMRLSNESSCDVDKLFKSLFIFLSLDLSLDFSLNYYLVLPDF